MIDNPVPIVPHVVAAEASTLPPEVPPGEASMPAPTAEQAQTADRLFASNAPNPICSMIGIATSIMLLRDVAVDTFDTSGEEEEENAKKQLGKDKDADCTD